MNAHSPDEAQPTGHDDDVHSDPMDRLFQTTFSDDFDFEGEFLEARILGGLFDLPVRVPKIARFEIRERLGSGGMGEVYAAWDPELERLIAIKLARVGRAEPGELLREARALARVESPHVLPIYDTGIHGDRIYMAMKIVQGQTLADWQRRERTLTEIVAVYAQAARGLAEIHRSGMVHCDFKPANVLVNDANHVWVADFGLARFCSSETRFGGTRAYMAPERLFDDLTSAASDQFSFCVALFEAIYQASPFPGDPASFGQRLARCEIEFPPDARGVPNWLTALLERGLRRDPSRRFPDMAAIVDELTRDRDRRRLRVGASVLAALSALSLLAMWPNPEPSSVHEPLAGTWDDARRQQLHDHFATIGTSWITVCEPLILQPIDDWAERWQAEHSRALSSQVVGLAEDGARGDCLEDQRAWVDEFVDDLLVAGPEQLWAAHQTSAELPPPERCRDAVAGRPMTIDADQAERLQARLADAAALRSALRFDESLAITTELIDANPGWPALEIDALRERGRTWLESGRSPLAVEDLQRAANLAITQREWARAADLHVDLIWAADATMPGPMRGYLLDQAEAFAEPEQLGRLGLIRALTALGAGDLDTAESLLRDNLDQLDASDSLAVVQNLHALALTLDARGHEFADRAEAAYQVAITRSEALLGRDHPQLAKLLSDAGSHALDDGDPRLARERLNRSFALRRVSLPAGHPFVARSLLALASLEIRQGNPDTAETLLREAIRNGCEREREYEIFGLLGAVHAERGDWAQAIDWYQRSLRALPDLDDQRAMIEVELAKALANLGDHEGATLLFDRSLAQVEANFDLPHEGPRLLITWKLRVGALIDPDRAILEFERVAGYLADPHDRTELFVATKRPRIAHSL